MEANNILRQNKGYENGKHPNSLKNLKPARKGEVRNPSGRPKKDCSITSIIKEMLDQEAGFISPGAEPDDKTWRQLIAKAILYGSAKGNPVLIKELLDRIEGKVTLPIGGGIDVNVRFLIGKGYAEGNKEAI